MAIDSPMHVPRPHRHIHGLGGGDPDKTTAASQHRAVPRLQAEVVFWGYPLVN